MARKSYRERKEPSLAKDAILSNFKKLGLSKELKDHQAMFAFTKVCGDLLHKHARPERMDRGVLYIRVSHSIWVQEMVSMKQDLLEKIQVTQGGERVKDLRFLVGPIEKLPSWDKDASD